MPPELCTVLAFAVPPLLLLIWVAVLYNLLVKLRAHCDESWSDIDTELQRRYELVPNLVETVKGYAKHERELLERVVQARNQAQASHGSPETQAKDENVLVGALRHLFAIAEGYPELQSDRNFLHLQAELTNTEDRVQRARRFYNGNVRDLNYRIDAFPTSILARMFSFHKREFFEIDDLAARQPAAAKF